MNLRQEDLLIGDDRACIYKRGLLTGLLPFCPLRDRAHALDR